MNAFDILIIAVAVVAAGMGFAKGIISQAGQIVALVAGIVCARAAGDTLSGLVARGGEVSPLDYVCGHAVAFIGAYFVAWLLMRLVRGAFHAVHLGVVDRLAGAAFKLALWMLMLSICVNVYVLSGGDDSRLHSPAHPWRQAVCDIAPAALGYLADLRVNKQATDNVK